MDLTALLLRIAARRPHVLVVAVPGATGVRLALEAALARRGWPVATGPADADVLAVAGTPGPALSDVAEAVWAQVPAPRARIVIPRPDDVEERLDAAVAVLADARHQRAGGGDRAARRAPAQHGGGGDPAAHGEHVRHGEHSGPGEHADQTGRGGEERHGEHGGPADNTHHTGPGDRGERAPEPGHPQAGGAADTEHAGRPGHGGEGEHGDRGEPAPEPGDPAGPAGGEERAGAAAGADQAGGHGGVRPLSAGTPGVRAAGGGHADHGLGGHDEQAREAGHPQAAAGADHAGLAGYSDHAGHGRRGGAVQPAGAAGQDHHTEHTHHVGRTGPGEQGEGAPEPGPPAVGGSAGADHAGPAERAGHGRRGGGEVHRAGPAEHAGHTERVGRAGHAEDADHPGHAGHAGRGGESGRGGHAEHTHHVGRTGPGEQGEGAPEPGPPAVGGSAGAGHAGPAAHADDTGHAGHLGQGAEGEPGRHGGHAGHPAHAEHAGHTGHGDHGGHGAHGGHHHHGGVVAGLPMAEPGPDRDGLTLDRLHVPLGPVLPDWPAGLVVHVTLQGDVVQEASAEFLDAARAEPFTWPSAAARELDALARFLGVAGRPSEAARARRLRDATLAGARIEEEAGALLRRIRRSRTLRWLVGDIRAGTSTVADLLAARPAALEAALAGTEPGPRPPVGELADALVGAELAAARLIVAALDPDDARTAAGVARG